MLVLQGVAVLFAVVATINAATTQEQTLLDAIHRLENEMQGFKKSVKDTIGGLSRQLMLQQLYVEEKTRSEGGSGLKMIRGSATGTKAYHSATISAGSTAAIHEHANYDRTVGMGEFIAVLNGLEFRTRHNDYKLRMPSTKSKNYNQMEEVPFPDVPPSVLSKKTVPEQVAEMQEYFRAFHQQDTKIRNYKPYFKPVLCYLEGGWTTNTKTLDEPFESDRHFIDASSWFDLQQKIMYMSATGDKSQFENFSYLPTTIINVTDEGMPVFAQWNYRIACHPIQRELALKDIMLRDDLAARMLLARNYTQMHNNKAARFDVAPSTGTGYNKDEMAGHYNDRRYFHGTIDNIMYEIPGKDNYMGNIEDRSFDLLKHRVDTKNQTVMNAARYHRHFKVLRTGAMGLAVRNRGFSDPHLYVAKTTNPKIVEMKATDCHRDHGHQNCTTYAGRHTYAIPLEIIWLTPLSSWNPYNLPRYNNKVPNAGGRNGGFTAAKAYNGTSTNTWYYTPVEFFHGGSESDPADTAKDAVGVLDTHGNVRRVSASGIRIFTPEIPNVGRVRIRYPIMPLYEEGNNVYKNMLALQDITMNMKKYERYFEQTPAVMASAGTTAHAVDSHYRTSMTHDNPPGAHYHDIYLTAEEMRAIRLVGTAVSSYTTEDSGHQHEITIKMDPSHPDFSRLQMISCDGQLTCWDHHSHYIYLVKE